MCGETYRVYEHIVGLPYYLDTIVEELEELFAEYRYSADEAADFISQFVANEDLQGRKRSVYVKRIGEK